MAAPRSRTTSVARANRGTVYRAGPRTWWLPRPRPIRGIGNPPALVQVERGISVSGAEFTPSSTAATQAFSNVNVGVYASDYKYEGVPAVIANANRLTFDYLFARGWRTVKIPIRWERIQRTLGGALDTTEVSRLTKELDMAQAAGLQVVIDLHNYGLYYIDGSQTTPAQTTNTGYRFPIGSAEVTQAHFADLWSRMATAFAGHAAVVGFHIMNEPQGAGGLTRTTWYSCAQAATTAIRAVDTDVTVRVGGWMFSDLHNWTTNNPSGTWITDASGQTWYEAHHYWSEAENGQYTTYANAVAHAVTLGYTAGANPDALYTKILDELQDFADWCATYGVQGVIGEINWPGNVSNPDQTSWNNLGDAYLDLADSLHIHVEAWATGEFYGNSVDPLLAYYASSGGATGVNTQRSSAPTWEAHPAFSYTAPTGTTKNLSDAGAGADALSVSAGVPLGDTGSGTDALSVSTAVPLSDTGSGTDGLSVSTAVPLSDTGSGTDALVSAVSISLSDTGTATDALTVQRTLLLADTGAGGDTLAASAAVGVSDTGSGTDALSVSVPIALTDTGTATDALASAVSIQLSDTGSSADTVSVTAAVPLADSRTVADALSVSAAVSLSDTRTAADALSVSVAAPLGDTGSSTDVLATSIVVPIADTGTATDALTVQRTLLLADTGAGGDTLAVTAIAVTLADTGSAAETLAVKAAVPLADTGTAVDAATGGVGVPLSDTGSSTDALTVSAAVPLTDARTVTDALTVPAVTTPLTEAGALTDTLKVAVTVALTDTGTGVDALLVLLSKAFTDAGIFTDTLVAQTGRDIAITWGALTSRNLTAGELTASDIDGHVGARVLTGTLED